jgi:hypothetical protein
MAISAPTRFPASAAKTASNKVGAEEGPPTILYDEIDTVFGPKAKDNEEIRGLLNAGHRRGAVAGRCVTKGAGRPEEVAGGDGRHNGQPN